ncbi:Protein phosphatase 2C domain containing protein [Purpureocillium lavendulum]|uniref:Protein phosphatase 2C domain containing protein n=1 Tax=Purpureocillium lavendulum TaxID=1247861 RepID=A0AB34FRZ3_9HYPO|nr:Protein phosphatase 2C domain containing protein [Purpureocillium lavendulum]
MASSVARRAGRNASRAAAQLSHGALSRPSAAAAAVKLESWAQPVSEGAPAAQNGQVGEFATKRTLTSSHPAAAARRAQRAGHSHAQIVVSAGPRHYAQTHTQAHAHPSARQCFHTYFVTHLPSSSLHPDAHNSAGPGHKLPRDASTPHTQDPGSSPAVALPNMPGRDLTVVRIPLRRAKHHFGSHTARGSRPYNEDADQAGIISVPAFAKRAPMSVKKKPGEATPASSASGDPQIFYFGVFDGHGGTQCAHFLRDELHGYIEEAAKDFGLQSSLRKTKPGREQNGSATVGGDESRSKRRAIDSVDMKGPDEVKKDMKVPDHENGSVRDVEHGKPLPSADSVPADVQDTARAIQLERDLVKAYATTIGGYFRRFNPEHFATQDGDGNESPISAESSIAYAFLRADLDFVSAQARKADPDDSDNPVNDDEILGAPHATPSGHGIGGPTRFKGGSTASVALISTPTPAPFWHPAAQSTLLVAHVGDSRILLCDTATGLPQPLTSDHHPSTPTESRRLRRYAPAGSMVSGDSFGEERIAGLANSRAFGDIRSKRIGVSAEPEITRLDMGPAQYAFLVLMSDGVSGTLSDQEIVDVIKEARTPDEGARRVVDYATEVSKDGDNATCQVVRLGGWERRSEGGLGSLGTKEIRDVRRAEAQDPRRGKR